MNKEMKMKKMTLMMLMGTALINFPAKSAELVVEINHIKNSDGKIYAQIFKGYENFNNNNPTAQTMIEAQEGPVKIIFGDLESGEYAVRLFHDQNNNQKLDQNLFGMPTEGYAFSNEAAPNFGPPSYQEMTVTIDDDKAVVSTNAIMFY